MVFDDPRQPTANDGMGGFGPVRWGERLLNDLVHRRACHAIQPERIEGGNHWWQH